MNQGIVSDCTHRLTQMFRETAAFKTKTAGVGLPPLMLYSSLSRRIFQYKKKTVIEVMNF